MLPLNGRSMNSKKFLQYFVLFTYFILGFYIFDLKTKQKKIANERKKLIKENLNLLGFQENESKTTKKIIKNLSDENEQLRKKLENPIVQEKIKYIVKNRYITQQVQTELAEIPSYYLYLDSDQIPVCEFYYSDTVTFKTLPKTYEINTVILEDYNYSFLEVTDYKQTKHKIEISKTKLDTQVTKVKEPIKIFNPSIHLGINVNYSNSININPTLTFNFISYEKNKFISPSYLFSENAIGIEFYSRNLGSENKLIEDTWLGLTYHKNFKNYYGLNISTKF